MMLSGPFIRRSYLGDTNLAPYASTLSRGCPFPAFKDVTLPYCEIVGLSGITILTTGNEYVFNMNSLYDPNFTGSGHQPYWYDQLNNIYKKYRVLGFRVRVTFITPSTTTMWCATHINDSQDSYSFTGIVPEQIGEKEYGKMFANIPTGGAGNVIWDSGYVSIHKLEGMSFNQFLADDGFAANINANPAAIAQLRIVAGDYTQPVSPSTCRARVEISYHARLYGVQTQNVS